MRYTKKAMIVAPQPEPTEAGADVLREGGNAVDAGIACALVQGVVDPHDVRHRRLRLVRHLHAGQEVPRLHRRPRAGAARRAARHVGQPDRERGARRLRLHPEGPGERHRLQVDLRAGQPQDVLRGAQGARQPAVVAHRRAGHRLGRERLDGAAARPFLVGRRRRLRPRAQLRAHRLHAGRARALLPARRHAQAGRRRASSTATTARPCAPSPRAAPMSSIRARSRRRSTRTCSRNDALLSIEDLKAWKTVRNRAAVGRLSRLPRLDQPAAGRRRDAARDAEHPRELRPRRARARLDRVSAHRRRGDEARHHRQGRQGRRSEVRRGAGRAS